MLLAASEVDKNSYSSIKSIFFFEIKIIKRNR